MHRAGFVCVALLMMAGTARAYLGGFEDGDGYTNDYGSVSGPFGLGASGYNVFYYNAGSYGTNNSGPGGGPVNTADNTGLWRQLDATAAVGNRYAIAHAQIGTAHSFSGDAMLGMRNDTAVNQDLIVRYFLDDRDFNGTSPTASVGMGVDWSLRVCPDPVGAGVATTPVFHWDFRDASLNDGLELGWNSNNTMIYKLASDATWTVTSYTLDLANYDRMDLHLNLLNNTWSLDMFDVSAGALVSVVNSSALDPSMTSLSVVDWTLAPNQSKNYFDESAFSLVAVPEPSSAWLCLIALGLCQGRRRRTVSLS